jgi:hypothetical protein
MEFPERISPVGMMPGRKPVSKIALFEKLKKHGFLL